MAIGDQGHNEHLQIWFCADCDCVHFRTHHVSLSFTRSEFAVLSQAVLNIYRDEIAGARRERIEEDHSILESGLIS